MGKLLNDLLLSFIFPKDLRKSFKEHNKAFYLNKYFLSYYSFKNKKILEKRNKEEEKIKLKQEVIKKCPSPKKTLFDIEIYDEDSENEKTKNENSNTNIK